MSRIGNNPIIIPEKVEVSLTGNQVLVKGPQGELKVEVLPKIKVEIKDNQVIVSRANDEKQVKACHGLIRSLIQNNIIGVTVGFKKTLKLVGTGYRVAKKGQGLTLSLGFSHPVEVAVVPGLQFEIEGNDTIFISGIDKQLVGQTAAEIRELRPPEPYKGKGIRYENEHVRRKAGKAAAA